jgi:hypothetical protein
VDLRPEHEHPVGTVEAGGLADFTVTKEVGHKAFIDAVEAEIEGVVGAGRRSDGVGAGDEFVAARLADGDKLSGDEVEGGELFDLEFEVLGFLREEHRAGEPGGEQRVFHGFP